MFNQIASKITNIPEWVKKDTRYWTLELRDRLLDGTFYDHLLYSFYQEQDGDNPCRMEDRRPAARFGLPAMVARMVARKLFAGRHIPRIRHKDEDKLKEIRAIVRRAKLYKHMLEIAVRGSVGSVAATFTIHGKGKKKRIKIDIWRAKYCAPTFDKDGELSILQVRYITTGSALTAMGATDLEADKWYWYIRDWTPEAEITYLPVLKDDWNPLEGFKNEEARRKGFKAWEKETTAHEFGFVPAQWFRNLASDDPTDGDCTFAPAITDSIDLDYTMSQIGRGVRYNAAPQLVVIGQPDTGGADVTRDPMSYIKMPAGHKTEDGDTYNSGDAKLLEMTGDGITAGLSYVDKMRNLALEQIQAARKDPEQMKGPMSGRAMEYLDDDWHDLVMELRSSYGEDGMLPFLKKIVAGCYKQDGSNQDPNVAGISLRWPRLFQPTPTDIAQLMPAFQIAVNPMGAPPKAPAIPGSSSSTGASNPGTPAQPGPDEGDAFMTKDEIRAWLVDNMDLGLDSGDGEEPQDLDEGGEPDDPEPVTPSPDPDAGGLDQPEGPPAPAPGSPDNPLVDATAGGVAKITAGAPS